MILTRTLRPPALPALRCAAAILGVALATSPAAAAASAKRMENSLKRLDPNTRFEQVCDLEAMARIRREPGGHRPDRAVGNAAAEPKITGNVMQGDGGAFRSRNKWYRYTFKCTTNADHMKVQAFDMKLGAEIPASDWEKFGLWK